MNKSPLSHTDTWFEQVHLDPRETAELVHEMSKHLRP